MTYRLHKVLLHHAALLGLLPLTACTPALLSFDVPTQVRPGAVFEVSVVGDTDITTGGIGTGDSGCVLQIPDEFELVGHQIEVLANSPVVAVRDTPQLLATYVPEPGHRLVSFLGTGGTSSTPASSRVALKLYLRAPVGGALQRAIKVALVGGSTGAWTAVAPPGVRNFAAITAAAHVRSVAVAPGFAAAFEVDPDGLPFGIDGGVAATSLRAADLDLDGRDDLVGVVGGSLRAWRSLPGAPWLERSVGLTAAPPAATGEPLAVGDFDGDGFPDLVTVDGRTFFGAAGISWQAGPSLAVDPPAAVVAGDSDSDGRADVIFLGANGAIRRYRGNANRTFTQANNGLPSTASGAGAGLVLADLTGDGLLDLYAARTVTPNVWVGDGLGGWIAGAGLPAQLRRPIAGDLDGDGAAELLLVADAAGAVGVDVYRHAASGQWVGMTSTGLPTIGTRSGAVIADVDDDGDADVLLANRSLSGSFGPGVPLAAGGTELWRNLGGGVFQLQTGSGLGVAGNVLRLHAGDFQGDGGRDLVVQSGMRSLLLRGTRTVPIARLPHGCGSQSLQALGTAATGTNLQLTVGGSSGIPVLGFGLMPAAQPLCAGCTLGHEWSVSVPAASVSFALPSSTAFVGTQIAVQAADVFVSSTCAGLPIALSDTLVATLR